MQRVEKASEFAVSEVFFKKPHSRPNSLAVQLQSSDQLQDHDDAYSEGRSAQLKKPKLSRGKCYLYNRTYNSRLNNSGGISFSVPSPRAAQALLGDWLSSKLCLELGMEEDEDDLVCSAEKKSPVALAQPAALDHTNFDGKKRNIFFLSFCHYLMTIAEGQNFDRVEQLQYL